MKVTATPRTHAQLRRLLGGRSLPLAFVGLDAFDANTATTRARCGTTPLRPASKSIRSRTLLRRLLDASEQIRGVLCFTAPEAVWLASHGFEDLLVAYPTTDPGHLLTVAEANADGHAITLVVDDPEHVARIAAAGRTIGVEVPVCIDLDLSLDLPGLKFGDGLRGADRGDHRPLPPPRAVR